MLQQIVVLMLTFFVGESGGIICYQCADSKAGGDCRSNNEEMKLSFIKYQRTINDTDQRHVDYTKNCTGIGHYCVTEEYSEIGTQLAFIRGCSDGVKDLSIPGFQNFTLMQRKCFHFHKVGNQTDILACVRWCTWDFCNGPKDIYSLNVINSFTSASCSVFFSGEAVLLLLFTIKLFHFVHV